MHPFHLIGRKFRSCAMILNSKRQTRAPFIYVLACVGGLKTTKTASRVEEGKSKTICIIVELRRFVYFQTDVHLTREKTENLKGSNYGIMQFFLLRLFRTVSSRLRIIQSSLSILPLRIFLGHYHVTISLRFFINCVDFSACQ